jgi:hypothetical protein
VEEQPPKKLPNGTVLFEAQQTLDSFNFWVLTGDRLPAELLRNTNRRFDRVHATTATLSKRLGVMTEKKNRSVVSEQSHSTLLFFWELAFRSVIANLISKI